MLPNGFDRADGIGDNLGTPDPANAVQVRSANGAGATNIPIEEAPESPTIERAEQATITHDFTMSWAEAKNRITFLGRGTLLEDSFGNVTKVLSALIQHHKGDSATLRVTAESVSFDSPPDEFHIVPVELGISIIKHPRYFYAFLGDGQGSATEKKNQMVIRFLQDYFENTTAAFRDALTKLLSDSLGTDGDEGEEKPRWNGTSFPTDALCTGTNMAKRAALEIIQKYWRGEETPYIVGYQITWSAYYFRPQYLNPGGYEENPMAATAYPIPVPDYFTSPAYPPNSTTIFDALAAINPQCYSSNGTSGGSVNISWLRKSDQMEYQRTWFKVDRTWIGSVVGFWDSQLYNNGSRPLSEDDYLVINTD